ncbi:uncharacterized protein LOC117583148 [Drosophila guanche]|uniref:MD-2-related lipid-recognition domain-containing protein n=1 Tax=Drosophila guanche TaxID=7266 RepID=A0A3B0JDN3_DROGU|nr:uncharacterized protein LOC117583148 [Drosophila guanche]SPP80417.1 Hypothetical predicted protein [Drosophila guanche]
MSTSSKVLARVRVVLFIIIFIQGAHGLFKATNIKCKCYDKTFCEFRQCELKVVGRGLVAINIYVKIHQLPVKKVLVNASLYRRFNGYRPFLYNFTVNFCDFMRHSKRYPAFGIGHSQVLSFSNLNHSCPYNHDVIVSNMILNDAMLEKTPFPTGSYMLQLTVGSPEWRGTTQVMVDIVEV